MRGRRSSAADFHFILLSCFRSFVLSCFTAKQTRAVQNERRRVCPAALFVLIRNRGSLPVIFVLS